jgi:aubergine-like protein
MVQICAKLGGVPWAIDKLPHVFSQKFTMVCAADCYNRLHQTK